MPVPSISAIVITKNEQSMIANCLECLRWCSELIVVDTGSDDQTVELAKRAGAKVISHHSHSFAENRQAAIAAAKGDWVCYIDADERILPILAKEILVQAETTGAHALTLQRQNVLYGKKFKHGGWEKDYVTRIFRKNSFQGWTGEIHESAHFPGKAVLLHQPLLHLTHRNTLDGLKKTIAWTPIEARLLAESGHSPVKPITLIRKGFMEFFRRGIWKGGLKDGMEGWVETLVQAMNRILVYIQVWELQQKPGLTQKYDELERDVLQEWEKAKHAPVEQ